MNFLKAFYIGIGLMVLLMIHSPSKAQYSPKAMANIAFKEMGIDTLEYEAISTLDFVPLIEYFSKYKKERTSFIYEYFKKENIKTSIPSILVGDMNSLGGTNIATS